MLAAGPVDQLDGRSDRLAKRAAHAGPEQRVDDDGRLLDPVAEQRDVAGDRGVDDRDPLVADDAVPVAGRIRRRRPGARPRRGRRRPPRPPRARWRAATSPSPPLLPGPARMTIGPRPQRAGVDRRGLERPRRPPTPACSISCCAGNAERLRSPVRAGHRRGRHRRPGRGGRPVPAQLAQVEPEQLRIVGGQRRHRRIPRARARTEAEGVMTVEA